jgi:hypothetical protein
VVLQRYDWLVVAGRANLLECSQKTSLLQPRTAVIGWMWLCLCVKGYYGIDNACSR